MTPGSIVEPSNGDEARRADDALQAAFRAEELAGLRLATIGRVVALAAVAVLLPFISEVPLAALAYYESFVLTFIVLGVVRYRIRRRFPDSLRADYAFVALDFVVLVAALLTHAPFLGFTWPVQMHLRFGNFVYLFLFLAVVALSYSPRLMLWAGLVGAAAWGAGGAWIAWQPDSVRNVPRELLANSPAAALDRFLDPRYVDVNGIVQNAAVLLIVAALLALGVWRSRRLVLHQVAALRERENLGRYFAPRIADRLARLDRPLEDVRTQVVTVLFGDLVGFTRLTEAEEPSRLVGLLREFHTRMEAAVFEHGGTLDKFIGDGVMATFGTPEVGERDAANALACAHAMVASIDAWNVEREASGQPPVQLSIGLHCGAVVQGNVGSRRRLEFTVLGDVVNVSSRLENLTRELGCRIAVSRDVVDAVRAQSAGDDPEDLKGLRRGALRHLSGREAPVEVWTWGNAAATGEAARMRSEL